MRPQGFAVVEKLARRAKEQRGGNVAVRLDFDRSAPDALALWHDAYLESLASRNYSPGTLGGRRDALKLFRSWAAERDLHQVGQVTRPILESFQRWLWRYTRHPNYFGDACTWWGLFLVAAETPYGLFALPGPVLLTWTLMKWSGAPTLEHRLRKTRPDYVRYMETTSGFVPWWPKQP